MRCLLLCVAILLIASLFLAVAKEENVDKDVDEIHPLVRKLCMYLIELEKSRLSSLRLNAAHQYNNTKCNPTTSCIILMKPDEPSKLLTTEPSNPIETKINKTTSQIFNDQASNSSCECTINSCYKIYTKTINSEPECYNLTCNAVVDVCQNCCHNALACQNTSNESDEIQILESSYACLDDDYCKNNNNISDDSHHLINEYNNVNDIKYSSETSKHTESNSYSIDYCQSYEVNEKYTECEECGPIISNDKDNENFYNGPNPGNPCCEVKNDSKYNFEDQNVNSKSCIDCQPLSHPNSDSSEQCCHHQSSTNHERQETFSNAHDKCRASCSEMYNCPSFVPDKVCKQDSCRKLCTGQSGRFQSQPEQYSSAFSTICPEPFSECIPSQVIGQKLFQRCCPRMPCHNSARRNYFTTPPKRSLTCNRCFY